MYLTNFPIVFFFFFFCFFFLSSPLRYPFDDHNAPPFSMILPFCEDVHRYLAADPKNIVAVHCKAGKGRTGVMICCYVVFCGRFTTADAAMQYYGIARTKNGKGVTIPSQQRYVQYFGDFILQQQQQQQQLSSFSSLGPLQPSIKVSMFLRRSASTARRSGRVILQLLVQHGFCKGKRPAVDQTGAGQGEQGQVTLNFPRKLSAHPDLRASPPGFPYCYC